jgi:hypothetical protein
MGIVCVTKLVVLWYLFWNDRLWNNMKKIVVDCCFTKPITKSWKSLDNLIWRKLSLFGYAVARLLCLLMKSIFFTVLLLMRQFFFLLARHIVKVLNSTHSKLSTEEINPIMLHLFCWWWCLCVFVCVCVYVCVCVSNKPSNRENRVACARQIPGLIQSRTMPRHLEFRLNVSPERKRK